MKRNMSLKFKLIGLTFTMVLVPVLVGSGLFLYNLDQFKDMALSSAKSGIVHEAEGSLTNRAAGAREEVRSFLRSGKQSVRSLADSVNLSRYLESKAGNNKELNQFARKEVRRIVNGLKSSAEEQSALLEQYDLSGEGEPPARNTAQDLIKNRMSRIEIGEEGYIYVMNPEGELLYHPDSSLVGKNVVSDLDLTRLQQLLDSPSPDSVGFLNYTFQGRKKFVGYRFYPEWDWIICGSGYWDDLTSQATTFSKDKFQQELKGVMQSTTLEMDGQQKKLLTQLRYLNQEGAEEFKLINGKFSDSLGDGSSTEWFRQASELDKGEIYNAGVKESEGGDVEMLLASPVYVDGSFKGVVAANLDWSLVWSLLSDYTFGDSGYVYILNNKGMIVSHPENDYTDRVDGTSSDFGKLADIISNKMLAGESGTANYMFRGTEKYMAYMPLQVGDMTYPMAATVSSSQFLQPVRELNERASSIFSNQVNFLLLGSGSFLVLALLAGYFLSRRISDQISRIIDNLRGSARQVSSASNQLSSSSQKLAEGSSEQASSLEETSSSLEEMSSQTKQNADNSGQADSAVKETASQVESGTEAVQRMSRAMEQIKNNTSETSRIIKTIDDIAFQTNLLALNAAVEAARAGEAGKGFAVVAEEVRNLAQRSADAAKETSELIEKSQTSANNGAQVAEEVSSNLESIKQSTEKVNTLIGEISAASSEQSQGIEQVNNAVSEMDKVVQQNASDAEESSSAAEELNSQAKELQDIVGQLTELVYGEAEEVQARQQGSDRTSGPDSAQGNRKSLEGGAGHSRGRKSHGGAERDQGGRNTQKQEQSKSDQMIPLDDNDDFKDF